MVQHGIAGTAQAILKVIMLRLAASDVEVQAVIFPKLACLLPCCRATTLQLEDHGPNSSQLLAHAPAACLDVPATEYCFEHGNTAASGLRDSFHALHHMEKPCLRLLQALSGITAVMTHDE